MTTYNLYKIASYFSIISKEGADISEEEFKKFEAEEKQNNKNDQNTLADQIQKLIIRGGKPVEVFISPQLSLSIGVERSIVQAYINKHSINIFITELLSWKKEDELSGIGPVLLNIVNTLLPLMKYLQNGFNPQELYNGGSGGMSALEDKIEEYISVVEQLKITLLNPQTHKKFLRLFPFLLEK